MGENEKIIKIKKNKNMNIPKKYTITIPDLTMEEARKIADDIFGSMMWGKGENGEMLVCYPGNNPVAICEQAPVANNTGDVSDLDGYLGEMGYDYCPLLEVVRAAKTKGVGMMKSDLIDNQTESLNEGVTMFRGSVGELVEAIYDRFVSGETIQIMLNTLRDRKVRGLHLGDYGSLGSGLH